MLVLTLVLRLSVLDDNVGNGIPRVVDADEQEQHRHTTGAEVDPHEHQSSQCRSSGAGDDVKVLPGGKRRHRSLLHDRSPLSMYMHTLDCPYTFSLMRTRQDWMELPARGPRTRGTRRPISTL